MRIVVKIGGVLLQTRAPGRGVENRKCPKVVRGGCKRSFEPRERQPCFAPVQPGVAPVQNRVAHGASDSWETFVPWGSERPFAPSPNHFRAFPYFRPLSQALCFE